MLHHFHGKSENKSQAQTDSRRMDDTWVWIPESLVQWFLEISCYKRLRQEGSTEGTAYSPVLVQHGVQGKNLEVIICGRWWRASMTCPGTCMWVHTGVISCPASKSPSCVGGSSLMEIFNGKSDTCSLDPWQEGHRTVTSKMCQINDLTQDYESSVSDPGKQRIVYNSS